MTQKEMDILEKKIVLLFSHTRMLSFVYGPICALSMALSVYLMFGAVARDNAAVFFVSLVWLVGPVCGWQAAKIYLCDQLLKLGEVLAKEDR